MTEVYKTRYQADKVKKTDPYHNSMDVIVKIDGGYVIMDPEEYRIWKKQR